MKSFQVAVCVALLGGIVVADTAYGALFQRRWNRRSAEIRAQVTRQVTAKMRQDLASGMSQVSQELQSANAALVQTETEKLQAEAAKLRSEIQQELAQLKQQAQQMVAMEAQRLEEQTSNRMKALQADAQQRIEEESKKLQQFVAAEVEKAREAAQKQLAAQLPNMVNQEIDNSSNRLKDAMMPALLVALRQELQADGRQPPQPQQPDKPEPKAIPQAPLKLEDEE